MGVACLAALPGAVPLAGAFGLGHVVVLSTLGQPLSANIEITQITPDEAQSLRVGVAPDSLYEAQHLSYSDALQGATVLLRQDASGHSYLHLSGTRPVHEPFVDLLLRADWAHGQLTRNYTLLLDPPGFREPGVAPIVPQAAAPLARAVQRTLPAAPPPAGSRSGYTVQRGDTLFAIARSYAGGEVSLDQMLAAMYSANQGAFIDGDINRLRAGAVLKVPSAGQAQALSSSQAHQIIVAHSGDFGAYRRRLAGLSPTRSGDNARSMHGTVQARVQEPGSGASGPQSQLRLSQAGVAAPGQTAEANWIAAQKQAEALAAKLAAAKADVAALAKLAASASAAARAMQPGAAAASTPQAAPHASAAAAAASAPSHAGASAPLAAAASGAARAGASAPAAASAAASAPLHTASAPPKPAPAKPEAKPAAKPHEAPAASHGPGLFGGLLANPLLAPAGLLLGVLLAGWAVLRRRRGSAGGQASVFDSHMGGTDSFFGASGGERVDTNNSTLGSSMQYSPSQVESVDVDPVAEADVYLAYGRDLQAEEILKEALKNHPDRNAARLKLLEIYAKRKDARSFELTAAELFTRTDGQGEEWKKVQELGRNLDAANPLYHNTQPPAMGSAMTTITGGDFDASQPVTTEPAPTMPPTELLAGLPSLSALQETAGAGSALDLALDLGGAGAPPAAAPAEPAEQDMGLDFDLSALTLPPAAEAAAPAPAATAAPEPAPLEFDLGLPPVSEHAPAEPAQALDTRLALVEESRAMGDLDTARHLLHEIIAESDGETRAAAEKLLAQLG
ncbi:FimV/HubP family polar landmark protein [Thiomonas sp. FB-6]|uniref:FimV/HubP family polar landmark protein n=1 Tax=Thiomonas sp. FB-6 TaxID=1158291 RepID=UPI0003754C65|nr:FimV/HubP family polar landmark protein [Thiomonas sp. FB-6]